MKKLLLISVIFPFMGYAQSNSSLYGLYLGSNTALNSNVGVASVDAGTAIVSYVKAFSNTTINAFGDHAVDPLNNRFFQVKGDSVNMYLLNFSIDDGTLTNILFTVDSVGNGAAGSVTIGGNIQGTFYNCDDGMIYFFHYKAPYEDYIHFAKADPTSGFVTELDSFPNGIDVLDNLVVPIHQVAYWLKYNNITYAYDTLVAYDLVDNTSSAVPMSIAVPNSSFWELTFNPIDGLLYGMQEDLDSFSVNNYLADLRFIKVDPVTGTVTNLTTDFLGNIIASNMSFNFSANKLNAIIQTENPGYPQLCTYDVLLNSYTTQNLGYTNFGSILYPDLIGIDSYLIPKDCHVATGEEAVQPDCNDPVSTGLNDGNPVLYFGCHWKELLGMHLRIFDSWGRKISDQLIDGPEAEINLKNAATQMFFYSITDQDHLKASGKLIAVK